MADRTSGQVPKRLVSEVLSIYSTEFGPSRLTAGSHAVEPKLHPFAVRSYTDSEYSRLERLSGVRNYQINLHFPWYDRSIESISEFIWRYHRIKENLRAVADMLSMNGHILSMTIQVPVSCYSQGRLHPPGHLENLMLAYYVDILAPLGRVCVRKPVTILPVHDCDNTEISTPCTKALDVEFARRTREGMRPLAGGELDHKERTWKEVKIKADQSAAHGPALLHPEQIRRFWGYLDNGHMDGFDTMARLTMQSIQRLEEERFAHGPRHLMQLQQHTLRASQGSDEAAP